LSSSLDFDSSTSVIGGSAGCRCVALTGSGGTVLVPLLKVCPLPLCPWNTTTYIWLSLQDSGTLSDSACFFFAVALAKKALKSIVALFFLFMFQT